jgi:hypothetical protein
MQHLFLLYKVGKSTGVLTQGRKIKRDYFSCNNMSKRRIQAGTSCDYTACFETMMKSGKNQTALFPASASTRTRSSFGNSPPAGGTKSSSFEPLITLTTRI